MSGETPDVEIARLRHEKAVADRRLARLRGLARLSGVIASSLDLDQVLSEIARAAAQLMEAPAVGLWVADEAARTLEPRAFSDERFAATYPRRRIKFEEGLPGWVAAHRETLVVPDVFADGRILAVDWFRQHDLRSAYIVPIVHQDALLGVLALNGRAPFDLDAEDRELLESFVAQAARAIRNARLYEEARGARDFLRSIAEHSPAGIVTTDVRGRITYWSPRSEELLGYRSDEVLGRPVAELQRGGREAARALMRRLRVEDRIREHEAEILARDGRWVECRFSLALLRDSAGSTIGTLAILEDTSERKRLEAQLRQAQKMEAVGRLAGGIAHDFNNLLAVIMGHSDLIRSVLKKGDALAHDVEQIRRASERAASLTRQLLAFSRRQFLQPQVIDVSTLVGNLATMLHRLIGEDVQLELRLDADAGRVSADPGTARAGGDEPHRQRAGRHAAGRPPDPRDRAGDARPGLRRGAPGLDHRGARAPLDPRHGVRDGPGRLVPPLRALLHDQGARPGDGARALHRLRDRQAAPGLHRRDERARARQLVRGLPAQGRGAPHARSGRRRASGSGRAAGRPSSSSRTRSPCAISCTGCSRRAATPSWPPATAWRRWRWWRRTPAPSTWS